MKTVFCRGVYLAENTSQAPSVRVVRHSAQGVRAGDCKNLSKSPKGDFGQLEQGRGTPLPCGFLI